ncbi:MAG: hypothetical protein COB84_08415 [Rhodobacteraceae bacterium]|nr:MAG: hypothetical protein COB84_08415 [Paracoccaceae bacterium]
MTKAFSKNFVNAGALAAIHSDTSQIAHSASQLIKQYFDSDSQFEKPVNFPENFDIDINKQVFRALDLDIPDVSTLKRSLLEKAQDSSEEAL